MTSACAMIRVPHTRIRGSRVWQLIFSLIKNSNCDHEDHTWAHRRLTCGAVGRGAVEIFGEIIMNQIRTFVLVTTATTVGAKLDARLYAVSRGSCKPIAHSP